MARLWIFGRRETRSVLRSDAGVDEETGTQSVGGHPKPKKDVTRTFIVLDAIFDLWSTKISGVVK